MSEGSRPRDRPAEDEDVRTQDNAHTSASSTPLSFERIISVSDTPAAMPASSQTTDTAMGSGGLVGGSGNEGVGQKAAEPSSVVQSAATEESPATAEPGTTTETIQIRVLEAASASSVTLENVGLSSTIGELKIRIRDTLDSHPPVQSQRIIHMGHARNDGEILADIISRNSNLVSTFKRPACIC
jgi:hypothetical protein